MRSGKPDTLYHVTDEQPGISRRRAGRGFRYLRANGEAVTSSATLERIKSLAIPPAWVDVWICPSAKGHLQATGRDQKGRKQYIYHPGWVEERDLTKFSRLLEFAHALPSLRQRVDNDLQRRGTPRRKAIAAAVWLLDRTFIRIGNEAYTVNGSYGLTTLRSRHVVVGTADVKFRFRGKAGKQWTVKVSDRRIANIMRQIQDLPGQRLLQYLDGEGEPHAISSADVNGYIADAIGPDFSSKYFRTWGGTTRAAQLLSSTPPPAAASLAKKALNLVIDRVAAELRNTRAVCRQSYIHPAVIEHWQAGSLMEEMEHVLREAEGAPSNLSEEEHVVRMWLSKYGAPEQA
jgi:DNA topoisomerase-1